VIMEVNHPSGPCIPGQMRPFVDIHGHIYPCERVSDGSEAVRIGHIDTGIDIDKAIAMLNVGKLTAQQCRDCWCFAHCGLCVAACEDNGKLTGEMRLTRCDESKNRTMSRLRTICVLKENGYDFTGMEGLYVR